MPPTTYGSAKYCRSKTDSKYRGTLNMIFMQGNPRQATERCAAATTERVGTQEVKRQSGLMGNHERGIRSVSPARKGRNIRILHQERPLTWPWIYSKGQCPISVWRNSVDDNLAELKVLKVGEHPTGQSRANP